MSLSHDRLGHIRIGAVGKGPQQQRFHLGKVGKGQSSDWHGGLKGSENKSASVQTESYLQ